MEQLKESGAKSVWGFDVDENIKSLCQDVTIGKNVHDLAQFDDNSYDIVTAVEVLEHVTEDLVMMDHLKRIAKEKVLMTTPCYHRSRCFNGAHCREYTIPQFMNIFKPDEVWSAAPSGTAHRTLLLERDGDVIIDHSPEGCMNKRKMETLPYYQGKIPFNLPFDQTVDGEEWPCICAIFTL
jgi:2-polyprenyl-3-methyl-5-hydroxy-6-metoxy-1,4-benzoquinol methylase